MTRSSPRNSAPWGRIGGRRIGRGRCHSGGSGGGPQRCCGGSLQEAAAAESMIAVKGHYFPRIVGRCDPPIPALGPLGNLPRWTRVCQDSVGHGNEFVEIAHPAAPLRRISPVTLTDVPSRRGVATVRGSRCSMSRLWAKGPEHENVFLVDHSPVGGPGAPRAGHVGEPSIVDPHAAHLVDLMCRTAQGDHQAFSELYDATMRRVFGAVLQVLRSSEHAEEVTQEVYAEIWQQAARFNPSKGSVITWMITIARRRAVDRVRSVSSEVARAEKYAKGSWARHRCCLGSHRAEAGHRAGAARPSVAHRPGKSSAHAGVLRGTDAEPDRRSTECAPRHGQVSNESRHEAAR